MKRTDGFTLIEMLVVIGLIVFLGALTFWGLREMQRIMREKTTHALVRQVASAIREFQMQYAEYPPDPVTELAAKLGDWGLPGTTTWYEFMNREYAKAKKSNQPKFENRGPWLTLEERFIDDATGDIIDVWKRPLIIMIDRVEKAILVYSFGADGASDDGYNINDGSPASAYTNLEKPIDDLAAR